MNVRKILVKIKNDPISIFLKNSQDYKPYWSWYADAANSYLEQHFFFYLTGERLLTAMSIARRYDNGPYWTRKEGKRFSGSEQRVATKRHETARFLCLDFDNLLIHSRILLDRATALTRLFLKNEQLLPSFTSFNKHRQFFLRSENIPYRSHEGYANYVREQTDWFPSLLKVVRDKFVIHRDRPFYRCYGWSKNGACEMEMILLRSTTANPAYLGAVDHKVINPLELISNVIDYLHFTGNYLQKYTYKSAVDNKRT